MICNWGVLGPGFVASRAVIPALEGSRTSRVLALASRDLERARSLATQWGIARAYASYQELLDDPEIEAIYLALPNHLHCHWTIQAARAGKHVLCEKPLARDAREGEQMLAACQQAGVQLMEAAMYRFHPRWQRLQYLVASGSLGQPRFLHSSFTFPLSDPGTYRLSLEYGGGALLDVGCYGVNALCWLAGGVPPEVQASVVRQEPGGVDLAVSALLHFAPDTLGHVRACFTAAEHQVVELVGNEGAVTAPLAFTAWRDDTTMLHLQHGNTWSQETFAPADPYQLMVEHFVSALRGRSQPAYPPEEALQTLRTLDAIRQRF